MEVPNRRILSEMGFAPGLAIFAVVFALSLAGAVWLAQLPRVIESETNSLFAQLAVVVGHDRGSQDLICSAFERRTGEQLCDGRLALDSTAIRIASGANARDPAIEPWTPLGASQRTVTSTRRLLLRPFAVSLLAAGISEAKPEVTS